jgi:hypothetical protein
VCTSKETIELWLYLFSSRHRISLYLSAASPLAAVGGAWRIETDMRQVTPPLPPRHLPTYALYTRTPCFTRSVWQLEGKELELRGWEITSVNTLAQDWLKHQLSPIIRRELAAVAGEGVGEAVFRVE